MSSVEITVHSSEGNVTVSVEDDEFRSLSTSEKESINSNLAEAVAKIRLCYGL